MKIVLCEAPSGAKDFFNGFDIVQCRENEIAHYAAMNGIDAIAVFSFSAMLRIIPKKSIGVNDSYNYRVFPLDYPSNKKIIIFGPPHLSINDKVQRIRYAKSVNFLKKALKDFSIFGIPQEPIMPNVDTITNERDAIDWITKCIAAKSPCVMDYETTGLNPHKAPQQHRIVSVALAIKNPDRWQSKAFSFYQNSELFMKLFRTLLREKEIICHNYPFEANWSYVIAGQRLNHLHWDTCVAQHCVDNNMNTGLKLLTYLYFGITYEQPKNIEAITNSEFNAFQDFPIGLTPSNVLYYNALDSLYTGWLYDRQELYFKEHKHLFNGVFLLFDALRELFEMKIKGIAIDLSKMSEVEKLASDESRKILQKIYQHPWVLKWRGSGMWDITKTQHLKDIIKINTGMVMESLEAEDLRKVPGDFCEMVLDYRTNSKFKDTYLAQFEREQCFGIIRPDFHLHKVETFRTSSSNPNFQNIPKRDKRTQKLVRGLFFPTKGNMFMEWDYKGVEVAISTCYHKDPGMLHYLETPGTDMHRDTAAVIFKKKPEDVSKEERSISKNGFVFPIFYGASYKSMSVGIWEQLTPQQRKALGMNSFSAFEKHIAEVEKDWWERRFPVYKKWRESAYATFNSTGYIEYYTGFRAWGPCSFTQLVNRPIQGSACHCLLQTLIKAGPRVRAISGRSFFIGQIHDSIVGDIHPEDKEMANKIIAEEGILNLRKRWKWITAPLEIEYSETPVDGSWADMKEIGKVL